MRPHTSKDGKRSSRERLIGEKLDNCNSYRKTMEVTDICQTEVYFISGDDTEQDF